MGDSKMGNAERSSLHELKYSPQRKLINGTNSRAKKWERMTCKIFSQSKEKYLPPTTQLIGYWLHPKNYRYPLFTKVIHILSEIIFLWWCNEYVRFMSDLSLLKLFVTVLMSENPINNNLSYFNQPNSSTVLELLVPCSILHNDSVE